MTILLTGGAGFIGSALARRLIAAGEAVAVYDALTYAASPATVVDLQRRGLAAFVHADIRDGGALAAALATHRPRAVVHLAAETHVDRSIDGPDVFIDTNVAGTTAVLRAATDYWKALPATDQAAFRLVHVSTDEVFGALEEGDPPFTEASMIRPRSPYAASKAAADHLALAWGHTYGLPVMLSGCTNTYGPFQFPEKLIPLMILNGLEGRPLPLYGSGRQIRDWLAVEDHAAGLEAVLRRGVPGTRYLLGARNELRNAEVVAVICRLLDELRPQAAPHARLVRHVADRPGHDFRYAADPSRTEAALGWRAAVPFEEGLRETLHWYAANDWWWRPLRDGVYGGERLGVAL